MGGSSPSPEQIEVAGLLLRRAESDLRACRRLADDPGIGGRCRRLSRPAGVEKALKAVLVLSGAGFPRTHDLDFLLARTDGRGIKVPLEIEDADWLTPWAAQLRYDEDVTPLNRKAAIDAATSAVSWARSAIRRA